MYNFKNLEVYSNFHMHSGTLPFYITVLYELWILADEKA